MIGPIFAVCEPLLPLRLLESLEASAWLVGYESLHLFQMLAMKFALLYLASLAHSN